MCMCRFAQGCAGACVQAHVCVVYSVCVVCVCVCCV